MEVYGFACPIFFNFLHINKIDLGLRRMNHSFSNLTLLFFQEFGPHFSLLLAVLAGLRTQGVINHLSLITSEKFRP